MTETAGTITPDGPVLPDGSVVSHPYVSYEGGTRVLLVSHDGAAWYRVEAWQYAVQTWGWRANVATLRALAAHARPYELVNADSGELWGNVNVRLPAFIARARLSCHGHPLTLAVADADQHGRGDDPYADRA